MGVEYYVCDWCFEANVEYNIMHIYAEKRTCALCTACYDLGKHMLPENEEAEMPAEFLAVWRQKLKHHRDAINNQIDDLAADLESDDDEEEESKEESEEDAEMSESEEEVENEAATD